MNPCFECGSSENLVEHHVVPRSRGGTKTIVLCQLCHDKVHGCRQRNISISQLSKEGIERARLKGKKLGNPRPQAAFAKAIITIKNKRKAFVDKMSGELSGYRSSGMTLDQIAQKLNADGVPTARSGKWTPTAVRRILT
jgi:hypothetical protein